MLYVGLLSVVLLLNLSLGLFVLIKNPKDHINISFALFVFSICLWMISNYLSNQPAEYNQAFLWNKLVFIFSSWIAYCLLYFSIVFPKKIYKINLTRLFLLLIPVVLSNALTVGNLVINGVTFINGGTGVTFGGLVYFYGAQLVLYFLAALFILTKKYFNSKGFEKSQLQYLLFGLAIAIGLATTTNFVIPLLLKDFQISNYGPFFTLAMVLFTAYAIVKHRLLDIRLILARTVAYLLILTAIGGLSSIALVFIGSSIFGILFSKVQLLFYSVLTMVVALNFQLIQKTMEKITDSLFYKGYYDTNALLSEMGVVMSTTIDLNLLTESILRVLTKEMRITRGVFILLEGKAIYAVKELGFEKGLNLHYTDVEAFLSQKGFTVFDDLEEGILKELMRKGDLGLAKVLEVKDSKVGLLILGHKASGEVYSDQDLKVLDILIPEVAIAVQNSQSYDKIKKFNIILTQEVDKATKELKAANEKLKELDKLKDDFVSVASHELRTPMTAIKSYSWMALNRPDIKLTDKMKKYLSRTLISTDRLINLVNDMLNISRIESGRVEISPKPFDIKELTNEVINEVSAKAAEKSLHLQVLSSQTPQAFADPDKVHQVLLNLVGNALKFTPQNGSITLSFFTDGQMVEVAVKDTGVGISKDDVSALFKKFGRLDNSYVAAATSGGTGLGLYISKMLVELMKGRIWVESEGVGKGTTFIFSLPIASKEALANPGQFATRVQGEAKALEPVAI